jgi:predicted nucleic acid-binding protein
MIIDTDVLIWLFRGNEKAKKTVLKAAPFSISAITHMELMQGAKNKSEQSRIAEQLQALQVSVIHVCESISARAMQMVCEYALSHSMTIPDAIIAATTIENGDVLLTGNAKHFEYLTGVKVKAFRP